MLISQSGYFFGKELKVYDYEALSVAGAAVSLTAGKLAVADKAKCIRVWITSETADIRYRLDGGDPTTSVGHLLIAGGTLEVEGQTNLERFSMIAVSGTASVRVSYARFE